MSDLKRQITAVTGGASLLERKPLQVKTREEALSYLKDATSLLKEKRFACDIRIPHDREAERVAQKKAYAKFQLHLGRCLEACNLLHGFGLIDDQAYELFYTKALTTSMATIVGKL